MEYNILILMIVAHVLDDFVLQPSCLSNLKQREWWKQEYPEELYQYDYIVALLVHGFSWSGWILVPWIIYGNPETDLWSLFFLNGLIHSYIDNIKANKRTMSLMKDQLLHLAQIFVTWGILCAVK